MVNYSTEISVREEALGRWRGHFRVIKRGQVIADQDTREVWRTKLEAGVNTDREAERVGSAA